MGENLQRKEGPRGRGESGEACTTKNPELLYSKD